jgi:hypothetical protein
LVHAAALIPNSLARFLLRLPLRAHLIINKSRLDVCGIIHKAIACRCFFPVFNENSEPNIVPFQQKSFLRSDFILAL